MNTAEVLIKSLESEGVKYIFGIPGEETLELMEAVKRSSFRFITVRHEQGAADANSDGAPLIAITGQVGTERMHLFCDFGGSLRCA